MVNGLTNNLDEISYKMDLEGVDWQEMKDAVAADDFDNGRTPEQLRESFENSAVAVLAYAGTRLIGTARALSDGVCNAYVVDVWTMTPYRHQGIASNMMRLLMDKVPGQHVYLFTDVETVSFYNQVGFEPQGIGLSMVVGTWLQPAEASTIQR